jgi:WD40 repeat protein
VAFSNDGKLLATASEDGTAGLWDWDTHRQIQTVFSDPTKKVYGVAFAPDNVRIAVALSDGTVAVINRDSPGQHTTFQASPDAVADVEFSPRADRLATASSVRSPAALWSFPALTLLANLNQQKGKVNRVIFDQQGSALATASSDHTDTVIIWDSGHGTPLRLLSEAAGATDVRFSPDGKWIASSSSDGTFSVWNSQTGALRFRCTAHMNRDQTVAAEAIAYSSDGSEIATLASNGEAKIWDAASGTERLALTAPNTARPPGRSIVFRPLAPDQLAIAVGPDVWLYDLNFGRVIQKSESLLSQINFRREDCEQYLHTNTCPVFRGQNR